MWLREENPAAGLIAVDQLEGWLTDYYKREWELPTGEARRRGREFLNGVERYSNLLIERGDRQYGFLHLTLEEMLAAKGVAELVNADSDQAGAVVRHHVDEAAWRETLLLSVGALGVVSQNRAGAGRLLEMFLACGDHVERRGAQVTLAGEALLDVGEVAVGRVVAARVVTALVSTMRDPACNVRERRDAGVLAGRLGWLPEPEPDDEVLAPDGPAAANCGLDAFRGVGGVWVGKYPVTNYQFARFVDADGYDDDRWWDEEGWAWRHGRYDSKAPEWLQDWLKGRPARDHNRPFWWRNSKWNSPLQPVVGVSWFEAQAYCRWLADQLRASTARGRVEGVADVRLLTDTEWQAAFGGRGEYPWGDEPDWNRLNCAESWYGKDVGESGAFDEWLKSEARQEASTTAVTTYPAGVSGPGVWDGSGNVWEWLADREGDDAALRGGSWNNDRRIARVSYRLHNHPDFFSSDVGFRVVVVPV